MVETEMELVHVVGDGLLEEMVRVEESRDEDVGWTLAGSGVVVLAG